MQFDLSGPRAVIIGNGNVALDAARILLTDPNKLADTDIADHALRALEKSKVTEVVLLGRRGPAQAAYTTPEFLALLNLPDVDVIIDPAEAALDDLSREELQRPDAEPAWRFKVELAHEAAHRRPSGTGKRLVFRYLASPLRYSGTARVGAVHISRNTLTRGPDGAIRAIRGPQADMLPATLVLESVGYLGATIPGVPFDSERAIIPNRAGRVLTRPGGDVVPQLYTAGWIKRGPSGVIGSNKRCAHETIHSLLEDVDTGVVGSAVDRAHLVDLLQRCCPHAVDYHGWQRVDTAERLAGKLSGRPRVKLTDLGELMHAAKAARRT